MAVQDRRKCQRGARQENEDVVGQLQHQGKANLVESRTHQKPPMCLEYILVHEMIHLLERGHTKRFHALVEHFLPNWRLLRDQLNHAALHHTNWPLLRLVQP